MRKFILVLVLTTFSLFGASFDCVKAKSDVEKAICQDEELSKLDEELNKVYTSFYFLTKEMKTDQREWLKQRNQCQDTACIKEVYTARVNNLNTSLSNQNTFPKKMLDYLIKSQQAEKVETPQLKEKQFSTEEFFKDLFTFKNIKVNEPLLYKVDYNDTKLKELLGNDCWDMRMDYMISDVQKKLMNTWYSAYIEKEFSLWQVDMDGDKKKELIFAQHGDSNQYYLLEQRLCKGATATPKTDEACETPEHDVYTFYDENFEIAHNEPYCQINQKYLGKVQLSGNNEDEQGIVFVVTYKDKDYILEAWNGLESFRGPRISISLYGTNKTLSLNEHLDMKYMYMHGDETNKLVILSWKTYIMKKNNKEK